MSDVAEGLLHGLIGGIGGGASAMANIYKDERQNAAKVENETQLAEARAQIEEERGKRIADYTSKERDKEYTRSRADKLVDEETGYKQKLGLISAEAEANKKVRDSDPLRKLQLKVAEDEIKLPAAEKKLFDAYQKEFDQNNAAIAKARAENTYDENSPSGKALADENRAIRTKMEGLLSPFLKDGVKKTEKPDPNNPLGLKLPPPPKSAPPETPKTASLPPMDIQQVNQELMKMGEPKMGWSKSDYSRYNQLVAMQKSQMGKK